MSCMGYAYGYGEATRVVDAQLAIVHSGCAETLSGRRQSELDGGMVMVRPDRDAGVGCAAAPLGAARGSLGLALWGGRAALVSALRRHARSRRARLYGSPGHTDTARRETSRPPRACWLRAPLRPDSPSRLDSRGPFIAFT